MPGRDRSPQPPSWEKARALCLLLACSLFFLVYLSRDLVAESRRAWEIHGALAGLDNVQRVHAMNRERLTSQTISLDFLVLAEAIKRKTPKNARVGIDNLPGGINLPRFSHYFLYPRYPFDLRGRDIPTAVEELDLDYVVRNRDGIWTIRRAR